MNHINVIQINLNICFYALDKRFVLIIQYTYHKYMGRRGRDRLVVVQSVPITSKIVSSEPVHGKVYTIQHYVIKFVSDLQQVGGFLRVLRFPPLTAMK